MDAAELMASPPRAPTGGEEIEFDYTELLLEGDGVHGGTPGTNAASVAPAPLAHAPPQQQTHISEADLLAAIMENENGVLAATTHAPQHVQHVQHAAVPVVSTCSAMPTAHAFPLHHQVLYSAAPLQHQQGYVHFTQPMLSSANYASAFMPMLDIPGHNALPPASVPPPQSTTQPISQATPPQAAEQRPAPRARRGETSGAAASSGSKRSSGGSVRRQPAPAPRVGVRSTSKFRGVTHHCRTGRWEAHIWEDGKQVYLGGFDSEEQAALAYDIAAVKCRGNDAVTNYPIANYAQELANLEQVTKDELVLSLRRQSKGFVKGTSKYRGVTRHQKGKWEARIGQLVGKKYRYLGLFDSEEDAAAAYDREAVRQKGLDAITNFAITAYEDVLAQHFTENASKAASAAAARAAPAPVPAPQPEPFDESSVPEPPLLPSELQDLGDDQVGVATRHTTAAASKEPSSAPPTSASKDARAPGPAVEVDPSPVAVAMVQNIFSSGPGKKVSTTSAGHASTQVQCAMDQEDDAVLITPTAEAPPPGQHTEFLLLPPELPEIEVGEVTPQPDTQIAEPTADAERSPAKRARVAPAADGPTTRRSIKPNTPPNEEACTVRRRSTAPY